MKRPERAVFLLLAISPLAFATACTTIDNTDPPGATLPSDAYFTGWGAQYATVEDCLADAPIPWSCTFELALCHTGEAGFRQGDLITSGGYHLENGVAVGHLGSEPFEFDLASATEQVAPFGNRLLWQPDVEGRWMTLQWDVISCEPRSAPH